MPTDSPDLPSDPPAAGRATWRSRLLAQRAEFMQSDAAALAQHQILGHLRSLVVSLEPMRLGLYWPVRGEFSAGVSPFDPIWPSELPIALPCADKSTRLESGERPDAHMAYRAWRGPLADARDGCGLPCSTGPIVEPDVLLVPCVGFTASGWRLGYGGGYFDRYLAAHPGVTAVGVAWSGALIEESDWSVQPHDQALAVIVTERGVV